MQMKIPFSLIWPIIKLIAPLIIRLILPLILQKSRASNGPVTFSDGEILDFLESNKDTIRTRYKGV